MTSRRRVIQLFCHTTKCPKYLWGVARRINLQNIFIRFSLFFMLLAFIEHAAATLAPSFSVG